jgi:4-hydroxy-2-oxoheptanedioate aldolase
VSKTSLSKTPENLFKKNLGRRQQLGIWSTLGASSVAELLLGCGFDWILIDTEHSPNGLPEVIEHLRVAQAAGVPAVVRPPWNDAVLVKRVMDQGAQTLLFPYVQSPAEAAAAVAATRFPPRGIRGVSGGSRGAGYGLWPDYFARYADEVCVIVQIETTDALDQLEAIAAVPGVDAVFIGPADLAAAMGHLGNAQHPDVQKAIDSGFARLKAINKPSGYLSTNEAEIERRIAQGVDFVSVTTDGALIGRAATGLLQRLRKD